MKVSEVKNSLSEKYVEYLKSLGFTEDQIKLAFEKACQSHVDRDGNLLPYHKLTIEVMTRDILQDPNWNYQKIIGWK